MALAKDVSGFILAAKEQLFKLEELRKKVAAMEAQLDSVNDDTGSSVQIYSAPFKEMFIPCPTDLATQLYSEEIDRCESEIRDILNWFGKFNCDDPRAFCED